MTFGRWLLVHSLSVSILIMLGAAYYFKNELKLNEAYRELLQIDPDAMQVVKKLKPSMQQSSDNQMFNDSSPIEQKDYLLMARQAYWQQDYASAIGYYAREMLKTPNSPDLYGELGNLYYGLKNYERASNNYLKAGKLMLEFNDDARAKQIYEILVSIAPEKANMLLSFKNNKYQELSN